VLPAYSPFKDDAEMDAGAGLQQAAQEQQQEWVQHVQHQGPDAAAAVMAAAAWPAESQVAQPPVAVLAPWSTEDLTGNAPAPGAAAAFADGICDAMLATPSATNADAVSPLQGWVGVGLASADATPAAAADAPAQDSAVGISMQQPPQSVAGELAELAAAAAVNLEAAAVAAAAVAVPVPAVESSTVSAVSAAASWSAPQQQQLPEAAQKGHCEELKQHHTHHHDSSSSDDSSSDGECSSPRQKSSAAPAGGGGVSQAGRKSGGSKKKKQKKNQKGKKGKKG
jgi:hypothetical protein